MSQGAAGREAASELADRPEEWPLHGSQDIWSGGAPFAVRQDRISVPDQPGDQFDRLVLLHPGAAAVLAMDEEDNVFVLRQYRHAARTRFVELPAGLLDVEGEDPLTVARRELREEAMLEADEWSHLLTTYPSPGLSSERIELFLARGLSAADDRGDFDLEHEEADMDTGWVPLRELVRGVLEGRFTDGPLAVAVLAYTARSGD